MLSPILEIRNLSKSYSSHSTFWRKETAAKKVLDNLSLNIFRGECLALIGQSGGGKSTLGRCILRLDEPDEGYIRLNGTDLLSLNEKQMRLHRPKIQMIYQDALLALNPRMTVVSTLTEPLRILLKMNRAEALIRATELLDSVGLPANLLVRRPKELSGGQRQRVAIARALATKPEFLIADEPTSSLDAKHKSQIITLLKTLQHKFNLTLLLISHDLTMVYEIADRVAVIHRGKIVEIASPQELTDSPKHVHSKELVQLATHA